MIRILIADDHTIVRNGLRRLCNDMDDMEVVAEAKDGLEVLDAIKTGEFDLLLLDLSMPGMNGVKLIERIRAGGCITPILILTMHSDLQVARRVLAAGASGFVAKGSAEDILVAAIRKVAARQRFIDSAVVESMMFSSPAAPTTNAEVPLSPRESEIIRLFGQGRTVTQIADDLCISHKTVSTHKARVMEKLNIKTTADLIRYATEQGLVE